MQTWILLITLCGGMDGGKAVQIIEYGKDKQSCVQASQQIEKGFSMESLRNENHAQCIPGPKT